jgi:hypothetical protein
MRTRKYLARKPFDGQARWYRREQAKAEQRRNKAADGKAGSGTAGADQIWSLVAHYLAARAELCEARAAQSTETGMYGEPEQGGGEHAVFH